MVPIAVLTRNRARYLDVTLRSLSGTQIPEGTPLVLYDDASDDSHTLAYYAQTGPVQLPSVRWPDESSWRDRLGLGIVNDCAQPLGIASSVKVERLSSEPLGVVNASLAAINRTFARWPDAAGVILLQDDVVFKQDWYLRMTSTAAQPKLFSRPLGVLAGIHLNKVFRWKETVPPPVRAGGITAQCVYISKWAYSKCKAKFFDPAHSAKTKFDGRLCYHVKRAGGWTGVILPFVCQHFGVVSTVRPHWKWKRGKNGRVGYCVSPPYAMADEIRKFSIS